MQNLKQFKTLKAIVEYALNKYPELRNSDKALTIKIWKYLAWKQYICIDEVMNLPTSDEISRIRRQFNEIWMYYPTNEEVLKQRRLNIFKVQQNLWYNV